MQADCIDAFLPPQDLQAERSVLGACLIDGTRAVDEATKRIGPEAFYVEAHRKVFGAMAELRRQGKPVDLITLTNHLERTGEFEAIGGTDALLELFDVVPTAANVGFYAGIVHEKQARRSLIQIARRLIDAASSGPDPAEANSSAVRALQAMRFASTAGCARHISDLTGPILGRFDGTMTQPIGLRCGLRAVDRVLGMMRPGYLVTLFGRPGEGKTTLMGAICQGVARHCGPVLMWSGECPRDVLVERLLAAEAMVSAETICKGPADAFRAIRPTLDSAAFRLGDLPLWLMDDSMPGTIANFTAAIQQVQEEAGREVVLAGLDRLEIIRGCEHPDENTRYHRRVQAVADMIRDLGIVGLLIGQPKKERKHADRPCVEDLQYGSAVTQHSKAIMAMDREGFDLPTEQQSGINRLHTLKFNDGPTGVSEMFMRPDLPAIYSSEHEYLLRREGPVTAAPAPEPESECEPYELPF